MRPKSLKYRVQTYSKYKKRPNTNCIKPILLFWSERWDSNP